MDIPLNNELRVGSKDTANTERICEALRIHKKS